MLLSVVVFGGAMNWGHAGGDDAGCAPTLVLHDHAAHRFGSSTPTPASSDDHCTLCHLLRQLHTALPAGSLLSRNVSQIGTRRTVDCIHVSSPFRFGVPSRAPPVALL